VALADGLATNPQEYVKDDEVLYRNVKRAYIKPLNGGFRPSSQAFTDPNYRISVYRAMLCSNNPSHAQVDKREDCVRRLVTGEVRAIGTVIKYDSKRNPVQHHAVRVDPAPEHGDPSHAEIYADPQITSPRMFAKLQEALVWIGEWAPGFGPSDREEGNV
jgi:hypothetical protein